MSAIQSISFNTDGQCVIYGTDSGFATYICQPFAEVLRRDDVGSVSRVQILGTSNVFAFVLETSPKKVWIWDDQRGMVVGELPEKNGLFNSPVIGIRITESCIAAVLKETTHVFRMCGMDECGKFKISLAQQIATVSNPRGLCSLVQLPNPQSLVLACPGVDKGQMRVEHFGGMSTRKTRFITAHDSPIACFALSSDGKILATASIKGTLIRLFDTSLQNQLLELRRGTEMADIYSMAFSKDAEWVVTSSDKRTVHVFRVKSAIAQSSASLFIVKGLAPAYLSNERSFAQYRLPKDMKTVVAFGKDDLVFIAGLDGSFIKCKFDTKTRGQEMIAHLYDAELGSGAEPDNVDGSYVLMSS